jgi:hypothetical protein
MNADFDLPNCVTYLIVTLNEMRYIAPVTHGRSLVQPPNLAQKGSRRPENGREGAFR